MKLMERISTINKNFDLWHRRLGHFDITKIKDNLKNTNTNHKCQICSNSKIKEQTFQKIN